MTSGDDSTRKSQRLRLCCLVLVFCAGAALADDYLILSLVGDHLTIITAASQVGSHLAPNRPQVVPLKDSQFDDFAVRTAADMIKNALPAASVTMLRAKDPDLYKMRDGWVDADSIDVRGLVTLVVKLFSPPAGSHLLLIAPYRDELQLQTDRGYLGGGFKSAGLGFYVDGSTRMFDSGTLDSAVGFLGVFTNFQLVLINLQNNAIEAQQRVVVGATFPAANAPDKTPWNALSAEKKIAALQFLLKRETDRLLPGMLGSAKP